MFEQENHSGKILLLVRGLAVVAALNCVVVPMFFAQQRPLFPLPGLYLIEIIVLAILALTGLLLIESRSPFWRAVPWIAAGVLLSFAILAIFSIGFYIIPAAVAFLLAGFLLNRIEGGLLLKYVGIFLIAAILQATLMITIA
jgi:hypothetical protein